MEEIMTIGDLRRAIAGREDDELLNVVINFDKSELVKDAHLHLDGERFVSSPKWSSMFMPVEETVKYLESIEVQCEELASVSESEAEGRKDKYFNRYAFMFGAAMAIAKTAARYLRINLFN